ncbi:EF-hand domain-containing protein [Congregibacter brevis]|uniref:EF-hand domain-containing protein n=1 Tax=Congregibacter brevis TaxID=3081201 RepID=A0ABZ0IG58_9GAMM|nr:EF-hand domain-containing protein [Congregibacter sp. IMCC45268]
MKKTLLVLSGTAVLCVSAAVMAQPKGGILNLDADGDGRISREEFQPRGDRGGPKMFKRADSDGDGDITRDEMLAAVAASEERQQELQSKIPEAFDAMDTDGNGVVSSAEAQDHAFGRLDVDGDGFVSQAELKTMRDKRGERRKRHSGEDPSPS